MTDFEGLKIPLLVWRDPTHPGPIKQLEASRSIDRDLKKELGRRPTPEEHHEAFQEKLGHLTVEVTEEQRQDAVEQAKKMIEELTTFVELNGGNDE